ncbi:MAG: hypothetical protein K9M75_07820, partial [Phycisphaerae bacterium]|nr:hypothetical protein [Phycisphaerae bacterium]
MASRRYKSFKKRPSRSSGRGGKKSNLRWIIVLLVIITAGVFIANQLGKDEIEDLINDSHNNFDDSSGGDNVVVGGDISGGDIVPPIDVLPPEKDVETSAETKKLIVAADKDFRTGKIIAARNSLNKILFDRTLSQKDRAYIKQLLTKLSDVWLFSNKIIEDDTLTGT